MEPKEEETGDKEYANMQSENYTNTQDEDRVNNGEKQRKRIKPTVEEGKEDKDTYAEYSKSKCTEEMAEPSIKRHFSLENIDSILKEGKCKTDIFDRNKLSICVEKLVRDLIKESIGVCMDNRRKTLFREDVAEAVRKKELFFLFDLFQKKSNE